MQTKGLKILQNVTTRWLNMLSPSERILIEYHTLVLKLYEDKATLSQAVKSYDRLLDVQILIGLSCFLPMLRSLNSFMEFAQSRNVFISDYLAAVKECQMEITAFYIDSVTKFIQDQFWDFNALIEVKHDGIPMRWVPEPMDLNTLGVEFLAFTPVGHSIRAEHRDLVTGLPEGITKELFATIVDDVKALATCKCIS
jgi:hypothetical protein